MECRGNVKNQRPVVVLSKRGYYFKQKGLLEDCAAFLSNESHEVPS